MTRTQFTPRLFFDGAPAGGSAPYASVHSAENNAPKNKFDVVFYLPDGRWMHWMSNPVKRPSAAVMVMELRQIADAIERTTL